MRKGSEFWMARFATEITVALCTIGVDTVFARNGLQQCMDEFLASDDSNDQELLSIFEDLKKEFAPLSMGVHHASDPSLTEKELTKRL